MTKVGGRAAGDGGWARLVRVLRPHEREVMEMRFLGLSDTEIGERLGVSRAAVGMRIVRARRRLAREAPGLEVWLGGQHRPRARSKGAEGRKECH